GGGRAGAAGLSPRTDARTLPGGAARPGGGRIPGGTGGRRDPRVRAGAARRAGEPDGAEAPRALVRGTSGDLGTSGGVLSRVPGLDPRGRGSLAGPGPRAVLAR